MKTIDLSKTIGLVQVIGGGYAPSNERQQKKLDDLFRRGPFFHSVEHAAPTSIRRDQLRGLRELARQHGYKIVTSLRVIRS